MKNEKKIIINGGSYFKKRGMKVGLIAIGVLLLLISGLLMLTFVIHDQ